MSAWGKFSCKKVKEQQSRHKISSNPDTNAKTNTNVNIKTNWEKVLGKRAIPIISSYPACTAARKDTPSPYHRLNCMHAKLKHSNCGQIQFEKRGKKACKEKPLGWPQFYSVHAWLVLTTSYQLDQIIRVNFFQCLFFSFLVQKVCAHVLSNCRPVWFWHICFATKVIGSHVFTQFTLDG